MVTLKQYLKAQSTISIFEKEQKAKQVALQAKVYKGIRNVLHKTKYADLDQCDVCVDFTSPEQLVIIIKDR